MKEGEREVRKKGGTREGRRDGGRKRKRLVKTDGEAHKQTNKKHISRQRFPCIAEPAS